MKKRTLTISLIVLAIMLLVGIGYAGWVISSTTTGNADGDFVAYSVEAANLTVSNVDQSVTFGKPTSPGATNWLEAQSVENEDLVASFTISWSAAVTSSISFTLTHKFFTGSGEGETQVTGDALTLLEKLISGPTYAVSGTGASISGSTLTLDNTYVAGSAITVTVTYQWGPSLGGSSHANPHTFFNGKTISAAPEASEKYNNEATYGALAEAALGALNTAVTTNNLHYKVEVAKNA